MKADLLGSLPSENPLETKGPRAGWPLRIVESDTASGLVRGARRPGFRLPSVLQLLPDSVRTNLDGHSPAMSSGPRGSDRFPRAERFWRVLRRRATHNRLFDRLADLRRPVRNRLCHFQTVRGRVAKSDTRPANR